MHRPLAFLLLLTSLSRSDLPAQPVPAIWHDLSPHKSGFHNVNGVKLHFLDWGGRGDALLLLHGLGDSAHIFDDFAPRLTHRCHVLALTRRGHGQSDKPESGYDTATLVEDVRQFLDASKIDRVVLVGHSLAGDELTRFAAIHPSRVNKLVYLDAAYDRARIKDLLADLPSELRPGKADLASLDSFRGWVNRFSFWSPAWEANAREAMVFSSDPKILREKKPPHVSRLLLEGTLQSKPDYRRIQAPALNLPAIGLNPKIREVLRTLPASRREKVDAYLQRIEDLKRQQIERFRQDIPIGTTIELKDTDHHCFIHRPEEVLQHIEKFLTR